MTTDTYWQAPATNGLDDQVFPRLRRRMVALVAALVLQATIALLGVLPELPGMRDPMDAADPYAYVGNPVNFWIQFAVIELIAAVVVSLALGPVVRLRDVPVIGRLVLGLAFVAVPAAAIALGAVNAAQAAAANGPSAASASWLTTAFFATLFFGLPLIVLAADRSRESSTAAAA